MGLAAFCCVLDSRERKVVVRPSAVVVTTCFIHCFVSKHWWRSYLLSRAAWIVH